MIENINGLYRGTSFIQTSWDLDLFKWILKYVYSYIIIIVQFSTTLAAMFLNQAGTAEGRSCLVS